MGRRHSLRLKKSRSTTPIENPCTHIPLELITEILVRLPAKSLLKFKCVSKPWLSLISNPQFVRSHVSTSSAADQCLHSQVLINENDPFRAIKEVSLNSALYDPSPNVYDIQYPWPMIAGIVNGLVCLGRPCLIDPIPGKYDLFIWNPVLRKSKLLPRPPLLDVPLKSFTSAAYGFGYVESKNDYKVFLLPRDSNDEPKKGMVYSLLTDSWRIIEDFRGESAVYGFGKYSNGKIHWNVGSRKKGWKIVSLDMASEKYGELEMPDYEGSLLLLELGVLGGRLSMLCEYKLKMDFWVMDKYDKFEESWSKVTSVTYDKVHRSMPRLCCQVLCVLENNDIVVSNGSDMFVYHWKRKYFRRIELRGSESCTFHLYVESLVSPNGSNL